MATTRRRLKTLESLFYGQVERHVAAIVPMFTARFDADQLRAVADLLRRVAGADHDADQAAAGAALLREWKLSMEDGQWRSLWLLPDVLNSVNTAIDGVIA